MDRLLNSEGALKPMDRLQLHSHQLSGLAQLTVLGLPALTLVSYHIEQSPTTIITIITIHYRSFTQLPPPHRGSSVSPHYSGRPDNAEEVVARITVAL